MSVIERMIKITKASQIEVMTDNNVSTENITRFAQSNGYTVNTSKEGQDFKLILKK